MAQEEFEGTTRSTSQPVCLGAKGGGHRALAAELGSVREFQQTRRLHTLLLPSARDAAASSKELPFCSLGPGRSLFGTNGSWGGGNRHPQSWSPASSPVALRLKSAQESLGAWEAPILQAPPLEILSHQV